MYLSVGTNWDDRLLATLAELNQLYSSSGRVIEVYGSLPSDVIGSVREAFRLPKISLENMRQHCHLAKAYGIDVNYTINSTVLTPAYVSGNLPEIVCFVESLIEAGMSSVTVASPLLVRWIRSEFPDLPLVVSSAANVGSLAEAQYFAHLGVKRIKLSVMRNRDFELIETMISKLECDIELLLNEACLLFCPLRSEHFNIQSLSRVADREHDLGQPSGTLEDYPYSECSEKLLSPDCFPVEFLKAPWIRPEDVAAYEASGVRHFKLTGRTMPPEWIAFVTREYLARSHAGNLLDLFPLVVKNVRNEGHVAPAYLENAALEGFLAYFLETRPRCDAVCGYNCKYCWSVAQSLVERKCAMLWTPASEETS